MSSSTTVIVGTGKHAALTAAVKSLSSLGEGFQRVTFEVRPVPLSPRMWDLCCFGADHDEATWIKGYVSGFVAGHNSTADEVAEAMEKW